MLGFLPYNEKVTLTVISSDLDKWGKPVVSEELVEYPCYIRDVTKLEADGAVIGRHGKEITLTYTIGIEGNAPVKVGDCIKSIEGEFEIVKVRKIRDLSGETITTLIYV